MSSPLPALWRGHGRILVLERIDVGHVDVLTCRDDFVERGHGVAGAKLAGVLGVIIEVAIGERAILVANQPVGSDGFSG